MDLQDSKAPRSPQKRIKAEEIARRMAAQADRLSVIESLPVQMQDYALVDWPTVAALIGYRDLEQAREKIRKAGVPLVRLSERRELPMWGDLRAHIQSRKTVTA